MFGSGFQKKPTGLLFSLYRLVLVAAPVSVGGDVEWSPSLEHFKVKWSRVVDLMSQRHVWSNDKRCVAGLLQRWSILWQITTLGPGPARREWSWGHGDWGVCICWRSCWRQMFPVPAWGQCGWAQTWGEGCGGVRRGGKKTWNMGEVSCNPPPL